MTGAEHAMGHRIGKIIIFFTPEAKETSSRIKPNEQRYMYFSYLTWIERIAAEQF